MDEDFDLEKWLKTNKLTPKYFPHQFHGNDIFNVHLSRLEQLELAASGRLLLFSRRATLVEDALAQLENARNWWTDRPYISELPAAPLRLQLRPAAPTMAQSDEPTLARIARSVGAKSGVGRTQLGWTKK